MRLLLPPVVLAAACQGPSLDATGTFLEETFFSETLLDDYILRVRLPPDLDEAASYPLIVQLDPTAFGLQQFATTTHLVSTYAAAGDWPEAIVVGIDDPDPFTRSRDYLPQDEPGPDFADEGADTFYAVLRDELLPHIEAAWPTDPGDRTLVGHSNGGVFGMYTALRYAPGAPPMFGQIVAADFGIGENLFLLEQRLAERTTDLPVHLYASRAVFNGATQQIAHDAMFGRLEDRGYPGLDLRTEVLDTDHGGSVYPSFEHGLDAHFGGAR